ncbi:MAG: hypothetical protein JXA50_06395 [Deltaproteobacteria bacterium]|nr:hypothetical protein [Deltaproteobacteria bacterium]
MSLKQWADNGWLHPHRTSREEIGNLFSIVERDLKDAQRDISAGYCSLPKDTGHPKTRTTFGRWQPSRRYWVTPEKPMPSIWMPAARSATSWSTIMQEGLQLRMPMS